MKILHAALPRGPRHAQRPSGKRALAGLSADVLGIAGRPLIAVSLMLALLGLSACDPRKKEASWSDGLQNEMGKGKAAPDRASTEGLVEGEETLFELKLPRGLKPVARFARSGRASGRVPLLALRTYVAERVESKNIELRGERTVIRDAALKGVRKKRYLIEIFEEAGLAQLSMRDQTPIPAPQKGLSSSERKREAGFDESGNLLQQME